MKFKSYIEEWVKEQGWEDPVEDEDDGKSRLSFNLDVSDQTFKVFIEGDDEKQWLELYMYAPFNVKADKFNDVLQLFNHIHKSTYYGRLVLLNDGRIQYKQIISLVDTEPSVMVLEKMYRTGIQVFENWLDELAALSLTKQTFADLLKEWESQSDNNDGVPEQL